MSLPPYIDRATIHKRLQVIFPEGVPHRTYCVREAAASAVFTMLYIGAIEGRNEWAAPKQIVRMSNSQAALKDETDRVGYATRSLHPGFQPRGKTWYRENSREQIRDETLRQGFITNNAVIASQLKLKISAGRNLPDIILVDMGADKNGDVVLVFIEVVATDGPVTRQRRDALLKIALDAGFPELRIAFVTAFLDRSHPAF